MIYDIRKLKLLRKFNLNNIFEFTSKINFIFKKKNDIKEFKLPTYLIVLKTLYNIKVKKLKHYFNKFLFINLYNFIKILRLRLDFILFDFNFFLTITQARHNIAHKHVLLNNKIARHSSYCVKNNDIIHICKIPTKIIQKMYIYNSLIKNINLDSIIDNTHTNIPLHISFKEILTTLNKTLLNTLVCSRTFKIKINSNNTENTDTNNYLNIN